MEGQYSRHSFSYQPPAGEPGAGGLVEMVLLNENEVRVAMASQVATWRRCGPPVS